MVTANRLTEMPVISASRRASNCHPDPWKWHARGALTEVGLEPECLPQHPLRFLVHIGLGQRLTALPNHHYLLIQLPLLKVTPLKVLGTRGHPQLLLAHPRPSYPQTRHSDNTLGRALSSFQ